MPYKKNQNIENILTVTLKLKKLFQLLKHKKPTLLCWFFYKLPLHWLNSARKELTK